MIKSHTLRVLTLQSYYPSKYASNGTPQITAMAEILQRKSL